jgi:hypothetical protein
LASLVDSTWFGSKDSFELPDRPVAPRRTNGCRVSNLPSGSDCWDNNERIENCKRCRNYFAGHLPHQRSATGEVGDAFGKRDTVHVTGAWLKAEGYVIGMTFGRKVDLANHWFKCAT